MTLSGAGSVRSGVVQDMVTLVRDAAPTYPVVLVVGPRGSGRSTVLRRAADEIGLDTVWIDCAMFAGRLPLHSLREALLSTRTEVFPRPMASALTAQLEGGDLTVDEVERLLWSVIRPGVGRLTGAQVVADDFDLLDPQTQHVAAHALRRIAQLGTPVFFSAQSVGPVVDRFPTIDLAPLTVTQARELIEDRRGVPVSYRVAHRLAGRTDGNVLALVEAVRELTDDQLGGRQLLPHPLPLSLSTARRLCTADDDRLTLLAGLAFDETVPIEVAERLVGSADALRQAADDGAIRFQGARVLAAQSSAALAAWWLAPLSARARMHRVLAESELPCSSIHAAAVGVPVGDDELARAATDLYDRGRQGHAGMALAMLDQSLPRSAYGLAQRLMDDGYLTDVRSIAEKATRGATGLSPVQVDALRTQVAVLTGLIREPVPVDQIDRRPPVVSRAWAETVLGAVRSLLQREDYTGAETLLDAAAPSLDEAPQDCRALAQFVRAELAFNHNEDHAVEDLVAAAEEWLACYTGKDDFSTAIMIFYLLAVGSSGLASAILNRTQPSDRSGALTRAAHLICRLQTELVLGHYAAADDLVEQLDRAMPYSAGGAHALSLVIDTGAARGPSPARERIEWRLDHGDVSSQPVRARSDIAAASGRRHLIEGDYERAAALLTTALESRHSLYVGATSVLASLLEANLAAGVSPEANRVVWKGLGDWWPDRESVRYPGLVSRCAALCVEPDEIDAAFEVALSQCADSNPFDVGRTYLAYGRRLLIESRIDDAARQLDRAQVIFEHERLGGWVAHVDRLRAAPVLSENSRLLSPTEREVVTLVLQRRTNAEIARTMYMSKRTVELHLTRVFRKFGVARKSELIELDSVRSEIAR